MLLLGYATMRLFVSLLTSLWVLTSCAILPAPPRLALSQAYTDVAGTKLAQLANASLPTDGSTSGFRLMPEATTALSARMALASTAERSIDAQYYIVEDDPVGLLFLSSLRAAARRGVRVRLLIDDLYAGSKYPIYAALAKEPNFEIRLFNPLPAQGSDLSRRLLFSLWEFGRINHRMHNKLFVADNSWAILGGRNIASEYFMQSATANFIDIDVLATGQVVAELSSTFDQYWNSADARPIESLVTAASDDLAAPLSLTDTKVVEALLFPALERDTDFLGQGRIAEQIESGKVVLIGGSAEVLVDPPEKIWMSSSSERYAASVTRKTIAALGEAKEEVVLISPYFIPGELGLKMIEGNTARGVRTVIFTNSLEATDETLAFTGYARYRRALLRAGVRLYELGAQLSGRNPEYGDFKLSVGRLHAKAAIIDRRKLFLGSMNMDRRSARQNTEVGILIDSPELTHSFSRLSAVRQTGAFEVRISGQDDALEWVSHTSDDVESIRRDEPGSDLLLWFKNWLLMRLVSEEDL